MAERGTKTCKQLLDAEQPPEGQGHRRLEAKCPLFVKGDVLARALEIVNPELPSILIHEWREHALYTLGIEPRQLPSVEGQLEQTVEEKEAGAIL